MSLGTTVVSNVSLNSSNNRSQVTDSISDKSCKGNDNSDSSNKHLVQHQPQNSFATSTHRECTEKTPSSDQQQSNSSHAISSNKNKQYNRHHRRRSQAADKSSAGTACSPPPCHWLVEEIIHTVGELEHTLIEDHQNDFELRMALERQTERVHDLRSSLATEKQRNERLVELIRGVDSSSSAEEDDQLAGGAANYINGIRWQTGTSLDAFESISPLLMQQRYDELALSHKQCRKQLVKKEKLLAHTKCVKEEALGHCDHLLDEYRNVQRRLEELCCKYLRLQTKKNQEILRLRKALTYASECVISAQQVMENHDSDESCNKEFSQNLQLFIKALRLCEWVQHNSSRAYEKH